MVELRWVKELRYLGVYLVAVVILNVITEMQGKPFIDHLMLFSAALVAQRQRQLFYT